MWIRALLLSLLVVAGLPEVGDSAIYYSSSRFTKVLHPGLVCQGRSVRYWTRRNFQSFVGNFYPKQAVIPCRRERPVAVISAQFELFKVSGDRSEGCVGYATLQFLNFGRNLKIHWKTTGSIRGMYCRQIGRRASLSLQP